MATVYEVRFSRPTKDPVSGEVCAGETEPIRDHRTKEAAFNTAITWSKKEGVFDVDVRQLVDGETINHWFFKDGKLQQSMF